MPYLKQYRKNIEAKLKAGMSFHTRLWRAMMNKKASLTVYVNTHTHLLSIITLVCFLPKESNRPLLPIFVTKINVSQKWNNFIKLGISGNFILKV